MLCLPFSTTACDLPVSDPNTVIQKAVERRARIYGKFVEKEYEKCDRLVEVLVEHRQKVRDVEERVKEEIALAGEELGEEEKETMMEVAVLEVTLSGNEEASLFERDRSTSLPWFCHSICFASRGR